MFLKNQRPRNLKIPSRMPIACPFCNKAISRLQEAFVSHLRYKHKELTREERNSLSN